MTAYRYARVLGEDIGKTLGQTIVVDNDAGANGDIATRLLRRAAPDGYTLIVNTLSHNVHPLTQPDKLDAAIVAALAKPALRARLATLGADVKHLGPTEHRDWLLNDRARWAELIRSASIKAE